jgi:hypothetical protein
MKELKEFKDLVSKKSEPTTIKILKRAVFLLVVLLIIMDGVKFGNKIS